MSELKDRLAAFRREGAEKFAALSAADNAVRRFADAKRENSAEDYNIDRIDEVAIATVTRSVKQSTEVYKMFAKQQKKH